MTVGKLLCGLFKLDAEDNGTCLCGRTAGFSVMVPGPGNDLIETKLCGKCAGAYHLQTLRNGGVPLKALRELGCEFPAMSEIANELSKGGQGHESGEAHNWPIGTLSVN
jgi:hypothetical protein